MLEPGASQEVNATIAEPTGFDPSTFPVYSGYIEISDETESYHVLYLGMVGSMIDMQVLDNTKKFSNVSFPALLDHQGNVQAGPVNYTFVGKDRPTVKWR
jgi:hypothetical protein